MISPVVLTPAKIVNPSNVPIKLAKVCLKKLPIFNFGF
ncbi:hypothetical protein RintRC_3434 [Richelia intracellularis]|nr:hypothetical protein RintRC_3434 [Richelia intracellularis]